VRAEGTPEAIVPHRVMEGNRPSTVILAERLTPETACSPRARSGGSTRSTSGVELGKALAREIVPELQAADEPELAHDSSTNALIRRYRAVRP
jgi:glucose-6-phosphate isomerase